MIFLEDPTIPPVLYSALKASSEEYSREVTHYLNKNSSQINLSVTALNKPVRQLILERRHGDEIQIDPLENHWHSFLGNAVHLALEEEAGKDQDRYEVEVRRGITRTIGGKGVHIHGKYDLYDKHTKVLQDWKVTSATSMLYPKTNFEMQLNVINTILVDHEVYPMHLQNVYLFPHLDKSKMGMDAYPKRNCKVVDVAFMNTHDVEQFIEHKVESFINGLDRKDKDLPLCTDEERWVRGNLYKGYTRKKAAKKGMQPEFSSKAAISSENLEDVRKFQTDNQLEFDDFKIAIIKGSPKYCQYCSAAPFCHQHQAYQRERERHFD